MVKTKQVGIETIESNITTIVETIRRGEIDGKNLKDITEKAYFNALMKSVFDQIIQEPDLMKDCLARVEKKMTANDNEAFNLRIVKLIKAELVDMFKEDIAQIMGKKKVVLDNYFPESKNDTTGSEDSEDDSEEGEE